MTNTNFQAGVLGEVVSVVQTVVANVTAATVTAAGNGTAYGVAGSEYLLIGINMTAITGGNVVFTLQGLGADGNWYNIPSNNSLNPSLTYSATGSNIYTFGPQYSALFPTIVRLSWTITSSPTATFNYWIVGQTT